MYQFYLTKPTKAMLFHTYLTVAYKVDIEEQ